ncbi:MAG: 3-oxoacyl-ACP synthase III [Victivallaceae bacterium]
MLFKNTNIDCFAYEMPPLAVTSEEIEAKLRPVYEKLKLPEGRLELMSGIRERRLWLPGTMPSDAAAMAGAKALAASSIPKSEIGCLINCSVCRDFLEPATATVVHDRLGLPKNAVVFDISNACLGVMTGMLVAASMIESGQIRAALLVAGENSRSLLESTIMKILEDDNLTRQSIKPLFASFTIGSGAVAVILASRELCNSGHRLLGGASMSFSEYNNLCRGNADKGMEDNHATLMNTDSEMLMQRGIAAAAEVWQQFQLELKLKAEDFQCFCTHQVGVAHRKLLYEQLGIDISRDYPTLDCLGNTGSVSCPMTAALAIQNGMVATGDKLAMLGIGSGINCTMLGVEW